MTKNLAKLSLAALTLFVGGQAALAQDSDDDLHPFLTDGFTLDVGLFYPEREVTLSVHGQVGGLNEPIDVSETVNLGGSDETFATELAWHFSERWSLLGQYFRSSDSASATLQEDVEWADIVFGAGTGLTIGTRFELFRAFVGREINLPRRHSLGLGGGLHFLEIESFAEGTIVINGQARTERRSVGASAPLPNIGAWYKYSISPKWALRTRLDLFSASIDRYDGTLINAALGVNYRAFRHVGIGISYNYFELDIGVDKTSWQGEYDTTYEGMYIYASGYW